MRLYYSTLVFGPALLLLAVSWPAMGAPRPVLPDICTSSSMDDMPGMSMDVPTEVGPDSRAMPVGPTDEAHAAMMEGMSAMDEEMATGMMAENINVAFICGMIPHHQGAVDMARAELAYGDDPFARQLAEKIIDSQQKEIDDMLAWLREQQP